MEEKVRREQEAKEKIEKGRRWKRKKWEEKVRDGGDGRERE